MTISNKPENLRYMEIQSIVERLANSSLSVDGFKHALCNKLTDYVRQEVEKTKNQEREHRMEKMEKMGLPEMLAVLRNIAKANECKITVEPYTGGIEFVINREKK